jgi:hypothetical protein
VHTCNKLLYSFTFGHYSNYATAKIPAVQAGKRGGRLEEGGDCHTIRSRTRTSVGRRGSRCVCFVSFVRVVVYIRQQTLQITDRVSVIHPHNRKGMTFVGQVVLTGDMVVLEGTMS